MVEIAFSVVAIPIKQDRIMLMLNLRAVTLLDDTVRKASERIESTPTANLRAPRIRRLCSEPEEHLNEKHRKRTTHPGSYSSDASRTSALEYRVSDLPASMYMDDQ
ncbi:hypothetical protein NMY22_g7123 [Coprinellus aureogranulatus]|nr:hypothetical protein NMY22_g7123 [Coprinellus aureogranulatus]